MNRWKLIISLTVLIIVVSTVSSTFIYKLSHPSQVEHFRDFRRSH